MMANKRSCLGVAALFAAASCNTWSDPSPPRLDHEDGASAPVFQPMLVVPLPELAVQGPAVGRPMEALQARQTPVGDVLLALFKDSDINLVIEPDVQAADCTFDIKRSTVEEAFEALLTSLDLAYEWDGSFLRIKDTVRETITVDLIESGQQNQQGAQAGGGNQNGAQNGQQNSFWDSLEESLPTVLGEDATAVVNRAASAVHVEGAPSRVRRLREMIDTTLVRANRQVSLEARVLEVRLDDEYSLGVNWSLLPNLFDSNKTGLAAGGGVVSQTAASGGTALTFGILDNNDFSVFVDALEQQGQVRVLSSPRVSTLNNQPASISVTNQVPYIVREVFTTTGVAQTQFSVEFVETGVQLQVLPLIGEDGLLSVSVTPSVREQIGTAVTPDGLVTVPIVSERDATTTVRVADGQAIALGGLRSTRKTESRQGLPFLMDIPWAGQLFSSTVQERTEVELMIVLVPRVLDDTWIDEEVERGAHRLVNLRRGFQWNPINLDHYRPEDWSGGAMQGRAQAAGTPNVRVPDRLAQELPAESGTTVTRQGLSAHLIRTAQVELDKGDVAAALQTLERALELNPTRVDALVTAGVLYERRGNRQRARRLLDAAITRAPDDVVALTARGTLEMNAGAAFAAHRYFTRAHELGNTMLTAANLGASWLALDEPDQARTLLSTAAGVGAPPELHANLAFAQLEVGKVEHASESLKRAWAAGADARNPRMVALKRLVAEGLGSQRADAMRAVDGGPK
ncbi:MAG: tetratricopeptide repeat protein [Planctomycetes bacterium]|nr:tetratricopeptide repeat protein [Planctomycetota bacterium]